MLHRMLCVLVALTLLLSAARAEPHVHDDASAPHTGTHSSPAEETPEDLSSQPPVQAYYHRAFFGEPWRTPRESTAHLWRQTVGVTVSVTALALALMLRRRRWLRGGLRR